jgi:hypothetical protein
MLLLGTAVVTGLFGVALIVWWTADQLVVQLKERPSGSIGAVFLAGGHALSPGLRDFRRPAECARSTGRRGFGWAAQDDVVVDDRWMRIGTWNLDARSSRAHLRILDELDCDVWLLTEVPAGLPLMRGAITTSPAQMSRDQSFAAVWSRDGGCPLDAPNPATAAMEVDGVGFYSSVLPWRTCGPDWPWCDGDQASRTVDAVHSLDHLFSGAVVWGGDWNQTMAGPNYGGTTIGRGAIDDLLERRGLSLATRDLPHRAPGMVAIDHIAVPREWVIESAECLPVPSHLTDHDAYVIDVHTV